MVKDTGYHKSTIDTCNQQLVSFGTCYKLASVYKAKQK